MMKNLLQICLLVLLCACVGPGRVASLDNERPLTEREIVERQSLLSGKRQMEPTTAERFDITVVGGACAPKAEAKFAVTSCVNEQPCNGHGLRVADGKTICACYEVVGGCQRARSAISVRASARSSLRISITCRSLGTRNRFVGSSRIRAKCDAMRRAVR